MINFIKALRLIILLLCPLVPLFIDYFINKRDQKKETGLCNKHLILVAFSLIFAVAITVVFKLLGNVFDFIINTKIVQYIVSSFSVSARTQYTTSVITVLLINGLISVGYLLLKLFFRLGMVSDKKKEERLERKRLKLLKKNNGQLSEEDELKLKEKEEKRKNKTPFVKRFENETWYTVGRILKFGGLILGALYLLLFAAFQLPAFWGADWIPYGFLSDVFNGTYLFPMITLLVIWEIYWFLEGIRVADYEWPKNEPGVKLSHYNGADNIVDIREKCQHEANFKKWYTCTVPISDENAEEFGETAIEPTTEIGRLIMESVENDPRNQSVAEAACVKCIDALANENTEDGEVSNVIVAGAFFSKFGLYAVRYFNLLLARGDNLIFICNSSEEIQATYEYLMEGFESISSLHVFKDITTKSIGVDIRNDSRILWKISTAKDGSSDIDVSRINNSSILVTTIDYLCSDDFNNAVLDEFMQRVTTVIYTDIEETLHRRSTYLSMFNIRMNHSARFTAIKAMNYEQNPEFRSSYVYRQVRHICFDDSKIEELDKALTNLLGVKFKTVSCMYFSQNAIVDCYNYESVADESGLVEQHQHVITSEALGTAVNMANFCSHVASSVNLYTNETVPYVAQIESLEANNSSPSGTGISVDRYRFNPNEYSVIVALDQRNNLPETIRKYALLAGQKPTLINVISRPYMLRDYYVANINELWNKDQIIRTPTNSQTDFGIALRILIKSSSSGISEAELFELAHTGVTFREYAEAGSRDIITLMLKVLGFFGVNSNDKGCFYNYFEVDTTRGFNENGKYVLENRIILRDPMLLRTLLRNRDPMKFVLSTGIETLPMLRYETSQLIVRGQNYLFNGDIYRIDEINVEEGYIKGELSTSGENKESFSYIQTRQYNFDTSDEVMELIDTANVTNPANNTFGSVRIDSISMSTYRAPAEVITTGYYELNQFSLSNDLSRTDYKTLDKPHQKEVYRRYGKIDFSEFSRNPRLKATSENGLKVLSLRIQGQLGNSPDKTSFLISVMLNEILHCMFPYVSHMIAVAPALHSKEIIENEEQNGIGKKISMMYPQVSFVNEHVLSDNEIEILIIEDCVDDLGVISTLKNSTIKALFEHIRKYMTWYNSSKVAKTSAPSYLYFGEKEEPVCFDFTCVSDISNVLGRDEVKIVYQNAKSFVEYACCDFCGKKYPKNTKNLHTIDVDGRLICDKCAKTIVGNDKRTLEACLRRVRVYLETTYGIDIDESYNVCFESTEKIYNAIKRNPDLTRRGSDIPLRGYVTQNGSRTKAHVEQDIPENGLAELILRQLTHMWQLKNIPELAEDYAEGHIALTVVQYLSYMGLESMVNVRTSYYESNSLLSGVGYRKLVAELLEKPQYGNNPFEYLSDLYGKNFKNSQLFTIQQKKKNFGKKLTTTESDRDPSNVGHFWYDLLPSDTHREQYDIMVEAITSYQSECRCLDFSSAEEVFNISAAILHDKPQLFQYYNCAVAVGSHVELRYAVSKEEADKLQAQIDRRIPEFMEGIDDSMSAYDAAVRIHANIVDLIEYDHEGLEQEKRGDSTDAPHLDYMRTICGAFINGKVVCAGYARAIKYLLHKAGIECSYCRGRIKRRNGDESGWHAWNIIKLGGEYYHLDATWDDSHGTVQNVRGTPTGYDYFCVTTEEICRTRSVEGCAVENVPECTATQCNFHYHNEAVIEEYDLSRITEIAKSFAELEAPSFTFKCTSKSVYETARDQLIRDGSDTFAILKELKKIDKTINPNRYYNFHNDDMWTITAYILHE